MTGHKSVSLPSVWVIVPTVYLFSKPFLWLFTYLWNAETHLSSSEDPLSIIGVLHGSDPSEHHDQPGPAECLRWSHLPGKTIHLHYQCLLKTIVFFFFFKPVPPFIQSGWRCRPQTPHVSIIRPDFVCLVCVVGLLVSLSGTMLSSPVSQSSSSTEAHCVLTGRGGGSYYHSSTTCFIWPPFCFSFQWGFKEFLQYFWMLFSQ